MACNCNYLLFFVWLVIMKADRYLSLLWLCNYYSFNTIVWASLRAQSVKNPPAVQETPGTIPKSGRSPREGNGNPLQCSCLENPTDRGAGGLQSMGPQRLRHDWVTHAFTFTHAPHHTPIKSSFQRIMLSLLDFFSSSIFWNAFSFLISFSMGVIQSLVLKRLIWVFGIETQISS